MLLLRTIALCLLIGGGMHTKSLAADFDESSPRRLAVSRDGKQIAAATNDSKIHVWELSTGNVLHALPVEPEGTSVAFSPDGSILVAGTNGTRADPSQPTRSHLYAWDITKPDARLLWKKPVVGTIMAIAVDPKGRWCSSITVYATLGVHNLLDGAMRANWSESGNSPDDLAVSSDGTTIATAGQAFILWNTSEHSFGAHFADPDKALDPHTSSKFIRAKHGGAIATAISSDDKWAITVGQYANNFGRATDIVLLDLATAKIISNVAELVSDISCLALSPDDATAAIGFNAGSVKLLDIKSKTWIAAWRLENFGPLRSVSYVVGDATLAVASENGCNVVVIDAATGKRLRTLWPK